MLTFFKSALIRSSLTLAPGFTTSPMRLKRYEGFEHGLNNLTHPAKITPYQR
jgi:hypothetical protein